MNLLMFFAQYHWAQNKMIETADRSNLLSPLADFRGFKF